MSGGVLRVKMVELSADEVPTGVGFVTRAGLVIDGRPEEFEALARRCAVFRLNGNH